MMSRSLRATHTTPTVRQPPTLQEVEDAIRDQAEDSQTTSLTPALLHSCLAKACRVKGADVGSLVARAFGPDWAAQQHKLVAPIGSIIRCVACGLLPACLPEPWHSPLAARSPWARVC